jgi:uncharacterized protein (DUF1330 family)
VEPDTSTEDRGPDTDAYVVLLLDITDPDAYADYLKRAIPTAETHGGTFVVVSDSPMTVEGPRPSERTVVISFPSMDDATRWYNSPAYRPLVEDRVRSAVSKVAIFEGQPDSR